ncbi:MAG: HEAT repeat domain-containing protein [Chloroflexota bacterium]
MEPSGPLSIKEIALHLAESSSPLRNTELPQLSNLNSEELAALKQVWATIPPERKRQIASRMLELAEDNFELNFNIIFRSLLTDENAEVRSTAINGLWEDEDPSLVNTFTKILEQDSSVKVQAAAALALGKFALMVEYERLRPVYQERISQALLSVINNEKRPVEVRRRALEAIAPFSLAEVTEVITKSYQGSNPELKVSAIYAMGRNCDTRWLPYLLKELTSTDAQIRYEAASALGELGEEEPVSSIARLLDDRDRDVQMAAIQALGHIGGVSARNYLKRCLTSNNEAVRQTAESALKEIDIGEGLLGI